MMTVVARIAVAVVMAMPVAWFVWVIMATATIPVITRHFYCGMAMLKQEYAYFELRTKFEAKWDPRKHWV
jgi:hypothetical protein